LGEAPLSTNKIYVNEAASLHISPNPVYTDNTLSIRYYNGDRQTSYIEITNSFGQLIYQSEEFTSQVVLHTLSTEQWKPGFYVVRLIADKAFAKRVIRVKRQLPSASQ